MTMERMAQTAKTASYKLAGCSESIRNQALSNIVQKLSDHKKEIFKQNQIDIDRSQNERIAPPLIKRLLFNDNKLRDCLSGIETLIQLPDPINQTLTARELDDGLTLYKISCPIGVMGIIFESRPDALIQISTLCLKSGNAVILKGGREAAATNRILTELIITAGKEAGLPDGWIQLVETREDVNQLLKMDQYIDLIIPRGSNEFVQFIMNNTNIPVLGHADGICHVFVDRDAAVDKAIPLIIDSKCQYTAVCNALETLLVDEAVARRLLPDLAKALQQKQVRIKGCERTRAIIHVEAATEEDWRTEYLDTILSIKITSDMDEAINHINTYGSGHTDMIITENSGTAEKFIRLVDSADVFWNASTRFSDGFRYGLGAEVGISTNKIHARGPVGMEGLLIYKWIIKGDGHIVADYSGDNPKKFKHRDLDTSRMGSIENIF